MLPFITVRRIRCQANSAQGKSHPASLLVAILLVVSVAITACAPAAPGAAAPPAEEPTAPQTAEAPQEPTATPTEIEPPAPDQLAVQILIGGPLDTNEQLHRAFLLSVDWQSLLKEFADIQAAVAVGSGALLVGDLRNQQEYDPLSARSLIDEAGFSGRFGETPLYVASQNESVKAFTDKMTSYLADVDITVNRNEIGADNVTAVLQELSTNAEQPWLLVIDTPLDNSEAGEKLRNVFAQTDMIDLENIDFDSAAGLREPGREFLAIVGAMTKDSPRHPTYGGLIIGVMHIDPESEHGVYPPGAYLIINMEENAEKPQLILINEEDQQVEAQVIGLENRAALNVPDGVNRFVFTVGTARCNLCDWVPNNIWCPCINCSE